MVPQALFPRYLDTSRSLLCNCFRLLFFSLGHFMFPLPIHFLSQNTPLLSISLLLQFISFFSLLGSPWLWRKTERFVIVLWCVVMQYFISLLFAAGIFLVLSCNWSGRLRGLNRSMVTRMGSMAVLVYSKYKVGNKWKECVMKFTFHRLTEI